LRLLKIPLYAVELLLVAVGLIYFLTPIWWVIISSFKSVPEIFSGNPFWIRRPTLELYLLLFTPTEAFARARGLLWFMNSIFYSSSSALIASVISLAAGYALSKFDFKGKTLIYSLIAVSLTLPAIVVSIPSFIMIMYMGWLDTYQGIIIPLSFTSFGVFLMKIFVDGTVPNEVLDAARVDGASELRIFFSIVLRLTISGVLTIFIIQFISSWNNLIYQLLVLYSESKFTLPQGMAANMFFGSQGLERSIAITISGSALSIFLMATVFLILESRIERSFELGYGMKG